MKELKKMLREIDRLSKDTNISDETYYRIEEELQNIIINSYSADEIEQAKRELEEEE